MFDVVIPDVCMCSFESKDNCPRKAIGDGVGSYLLLFFNCLVLLHFIEFAVRNCLASLLVQEKRSILVG